MPKANPGTLPHQRQCFMLALLATDNVFLNSLFGKKLCRT